MTWNTHQELKLGLLLVATAVLFSPVAAVVVLLSEEFEVRAGALPPEIALSLGLGFPSAWILLVAAPIWVDRKGPQPVMTMGAAIMGIGVLLLALSDHMAVFALALGAVTVGSAGLDSNILLSLAARGTSRFRGALFGVLTAIVWAPDPFSFDIAGNRGATLSIAAILSAVVAFLLYRFLPHFPLVNPLPDPSLPGFTQLWRNPFMRRALLGVGLVFFSTITLTSIGSTLLASANGTESFWGSTQETPIIALALAMGALAWGLASDRIPAAQLVTAAALLSVPAVGVPQIADSPAVAGVAAATFSFIVGGFLVLSPVLLAKHLPTRRFATLLFQLLILSTIAVVPVVFLARFVMTTWGPEGPVAAMIILALLLAMATARLLSPTTAIPQPTD